MKIKTKDLIGIQLDWAVAKCEGVEYHAEDYLQNGTLYVFIGGLRKDQMLPMYSSAWEFGGPLIEREKMYLNFGVLGGPWEAVVPSRTFTLVSYGETALVAAMRAFVLSRLGPEVEIPKELK